MSTPMQFIRKNKVLEMTGLKHGSLYNLMSLGQFPKQYKLSERSVAWKLAEVQQWIDTRQVA